MKKENILLAIHHHIADSYSPKWIEYCKNNNIRYKLVNCYDNDIIEQLKEFDALLWHWSHIDYKAQLFARQLIYALEFKGFPVYPNAIGSFYFDDKVGEKYLLESIDAPLIPSYVFYDKKSAIEWIEKTIFPKVFKLRSGAGAHNVKLINSVSEAKKYASKAFGRGFFSTHRGAAIKNRIWHFKRDKSLKSFFNISRGLYRYVIPNPKSVALPIEKNYLYAQDFIPNCDHDIRVFVVGDRAISKKRMVRDGDFRASGSGKFIWEIDDSQKECVKIAFEVTEKLGMQSIAFDFVMDEKGEAKMIEISYAVGLTAFLDGIGYWKRDLSWTESKIVIEDYIIEDLLANLERQK
jgi:glutathione synthase/RimK-type ligase-like ATP-grasp enzyme